MFYYYLNMDKYKNVFIGMGTSNLVAGSKAKQGESLYVEQGGVRQSNYCSISNLQGNCTNCKPACRAMSGMGGCVAPDNAAKLSFPPSGKRLTALLGEDNCDKLAKSFWSFYSKFAKIDLPYPSMQTPNKETEDYISKIGCEFNNYPIHISDEIEHNTFLANIHNYISNKSKILFNTKVDLSEDVDHINKTLSINGNKVEYDNLFIGTGRQGYHNTNMFAEKLGINRTPENVNIGFRVLLPSKYLSKFSDLHPDFKIKQKNQDETLETFCFSNNVNGGRIKPLRYDDEILNMDGHISVKSKGDTIDGEPYGNFGILFEDNTRKISYNDFISRFDGKERSSLDFNVENLHKFKENNVFTERESESLLGFLDNVLDLISKENGVAKEELYSKMRIIGPEVENIWARNDRIVVRDGIAMVGDCSGLAQGIVTSGMQGEQAFNELNDLLL